MATVVEAPPSRAEEPGAEPAPPYAQYALLEDALTRYRALAEDDTLAPPEGVVGLRPGARSPVVPALRRWLAALGDAAPEPVNEARLDLFDPDLVRAVKRFQGRHGLATDGVIGKATGAALAVPLRVRVLQIERALEHWRSMPNPPPKELIVVNIPEFRLFVLRSDAGRMAADEVLGMKVIVGRAVETETPTLAGDLESVIFRPAWNVPWSIVRAEMIPKIRRDPGYLAKEGLEIVGAREPVVTRATLAGLASGALGLRQRPGPGNSLGLVKFVVPNDDDIYLHATPATGLFARARRDFSHGCIRLEDPVGLAEYALRGVPGWTRGRVLAAMSGGNTLQVDIPEPIPVEVVYVTATALPGGEIRFFEDIYGQDGGPDQALARDGRQGRWAAACEAATVGSQRR